MADQLSNTEIPIYFKNKAVVLEIFSERHGSLFRIENDEAFSNGEAPIQILEGHTYEYILPDGYSIEPIKGVITKSKKDKSRGRITPNIYVGTLTLNILSEDYSEEKETVKIEVLATKFDMKPDTSYRVNYRKMLEDITSKSTDLLLQSGTPVSQNFETDYSGDSKTLYQRFCFVRSVVDSKEFVEGISKIISSPKTSWKEEQEEIDIRNVKRFRPKEIKLLMTKGHRVKLPSAHPLVRIGIPSVPQSILTSKKSDTVDNPENRFIKHVLESFLLFTEKCLDIFPDNSREKKETRGLSQKLEQHLNHEFFKNISRPKTAVINSPVLQRKSGYREVFRSWLMFDLAAKLIWRGGDDVYEGGKRDIAVLYEYWLFFSLYSLLKEKFKLNQLENKEENIESLFKLDEQGINLILKSGRYTALKGTHEFGNRSLKIKYSYNRSFKGGQRFSETRAAGSWTTTLRPDYTISFWPTALKEKEAEEKEEIVHIHFDAKYKVTQFTISTSENQEDLDIEEQEERKGIYKNPDLLKMHAYKDAIHRTGGAYLLYPGTQSKEYCGFHEIIPGLGAFAINPSEEQIGLKNISDFIDKVVQNLLDRSSQREQLATNRHKILKQKPNENLMETFPEYLNNRKLIASMTSVIIGYYKSSEHLEWILKNKLYNFRSGTRNGSIELTSENIGAKFLVLYGKDEIQTARIFKLSNEGPRVFSRHDLEKEAYPNARGDLYFVYKLNEEMSIAFNSVKFDLSKIKGFTLAPTKYGPATCSLEDLLRSVI